ncbi:hypothetical protein ACWIUD_00030 [Helicobacter sp. 23-1044]
MSKSQNLRLILGEILRDLYFLQNLRLILGEILRNYYAVIARKCVALTKQSTK